MAAVTAPTSPGLAPAPTLDAFNNLSITAVVFATLNALFGVYAVLFILALWSTYRKSDVASRYNRIVTIVLFVTLLIHYICRSIIFGQSRLIDPPANLLQKSTLPLLFITSLTSTVAGFISDGLLAWRFYVIYGRKRWALYGPLVALVVNGLLGFSGNVPYLLAASSESNTSFSADMSSIGFTITAAWGWCTFAINTALTGGIIGRILHASRNARRNGAVKLCDENHSHNTAIALIVESGLVTWIGLLLYEIATFAPTGGITTAGNVGFVMICIIPIFFGISQCLITARLGITREGLLRVDRSNNHILTLSNGTVGGNIEPANNEISITTTSHKSSNINSEKVHGILDFKGQDTV
ncbi:hypothetical protein BC835DRAFT_1548651 [Cytidiella melzeri]|nr:hypothetical protein BC835DRAFT_1548651 [Cytidiella melzeri]